MGCTIKRILQFNEAINFSKIKLVDINNIDITANCFFSWSTDMVCWTNWVNYSTYCMFGKSIESDFYIRILFNSSLQAVYVNDCGTNCYSVCLYNKNPFLENLCTENLFNPYANLDCALNLQQQLSDSIVCMLGIPIYYFRVLPQKDTADYSFKEYILHNVESVKQMKLMIQDGAMPSSKPQFSDLDFDWEVDWEVELSKSQFATAFGDTAFPKQRDFIYIPMMQRMWEVNSAYDEKNEGLMWRSTTWKLGLIKWNEKTNIDYNDFDDLIDNLVVNTYDNVFAELEDNEETRTTATQQTEMPIYVANALENVFMQDAIRKQISLKTISILEKQINNKSIITAKNVYLFNNEDSTIVYQKGYCGENGTLSFILSKTNIEVKERKQIITFGNVSISTDNEFIYFGNAKAKLDKNFETYMIICKWSKELFAQEIEAFPYIVPKNIPAYKLKPEMCYFDFDINEVQENTAIYDNDNNTNTEKTVKVTGFPFYMTNIKLFNKYFDKETAIKESVKYTTTSEYCIFNDVARPLYDGFGYSVK